MRFLKQIFFSIIILFLGFVSVCAWNGLIPDPGDMLSITKWNELITVLNSKLTNTDLKAGTNITLTTSGSEITINSAGGGGGSVIPYITTTIPVNASVSSTQDIFFDGINFTPTSILSIPGFDGTVNSTTVNSPTNLQANITVGVTNATYNVEISNGGTLNTLWSGNGAGLLVTKTPVLGTGPAGTYTEGFEAVTLGNWTNSTGMGSNFTINTGGTPSNGTGPTGASVGSYYIFTETSNPYNPNVTFAVETTNFRYAQSISFDYHMFGADIGVLKVQTNYLGVWTDIFTLTGQQQANQTDPWLNTGNIDLTPYNVQGIRIHYTGGASFAGDAAVDNISITSI